MHKLIQRIKQSFGYARTLSRSHPITFIMLMLDTVFLTILSLLEGGLRRIDPIKDNIHTLETIFGHLTLWLFMLLFAVFLMENIVDRDKKVLRTVIVSVFAIITYIHSGLIAGTYILKDVFNDMTKAMGDAHLAMFSVGYFVIISVLIVFFCYQKLKDEFTLPEYLMGVLSGGFLVSVIYAVVNIGALTLTFVFTELLFGNFEDIYLPMLALITGLYYGGALISVVVSSEKEVPKFVNVLFRYVLFGMSLAAYVIVYLYIIKITVLSDFPSNSVFGILTALFSFSIPLAYLNSYMEEGFWGKISRILPYIFVPLLFLQAYTVAARVGQYGLTPTRYLGFVFIGFEVMYIIWYAIKRDSLKYIFIVMAIMSFLLCFMPGTNSLDVPKFTQSHTFSRLMGYDISDLSKKEKTRLLSAYDYLSDMDGGRKYLDDRYSDKDLEVLKEIDLGDDYKSVNMSKYADYRCQATKLDVKGFNSVYVITYSGSRGDDDDWRPEEVEMEVRELGQNYSFDNEMAVRLDVSDLVELMTDRKYEDKRPEYEEKPLIYDADGERFVITEVSIAYDEITEAIRSLRIDGYLLK